MLKNLKLIKKKRGRKAKKRPVYVSKRTEIAYRTALLSIVTDMHEETLRALKMANIGDSVMVNDGLLDNFKIILSNLKLSISTRINTISSILASKIVNKQQISSDTQLADMIKKQTGLDVSGMMTDEVLEEVVREAIEANVSLIKSIPEQYLYKVEQAVMSGLQSGQLNVTLADDLKKALKLTKYRAKFIARDQLAKINSRMAQVRQESLDITHYEWNTSRDERVRSTHNPRHGKLFAWDKPPKGGHAGHEYNCRCVAIPYTAHLIGGKTAEEVMKEQD